MAEATKEQLTDLFITKNLCAGDVGIELGMTVKQVECRLRKYKIRKGRWTKPKDAGITTVMTTAAERLSQQFLQMRF